MHSREFALLLTDSIAAASHRWRIGIALGLAALAGAALLAVPLAEALHAGLTLEADRWLGVKASAVAGAATGRSCTNPPVPS